MKAHPSVQAETFSRKSLSPRITAPLQVYRRGHPSDQASHPWPLWTSASGSTSDLFVPLARYEHPSIQGYRLAHSQLNLGMSVNNISHNQIHVALTMYSISISIFSSTCYIFMISSRSLHPAQLSVMLQYIYFHVQFLYCSAQHISGMLSIHSKY